MSHKLPPGVVQGPDGKFVSADEVEHRYQNFETVTSTTQITISPGDYSAMPSETSFEGVVLFDFNDLCSRHEVVDLLRADVGLTVGIDGQTGDAGQVEYGVEVSSSPAKRTIAGRSESDTDEIGDISQEQGDLSAVGAEVRDTDDPDLIVRPLHAETWAGFEDTTNATGGPGSMGHDSAMGPPPGSWDFDRRDELFVNGFVRVDGATDLSAHGYVKAQISYGVRDTSR